MSTSTTPLFQSNFNITQEAVYDSSFDLDYWIMGLQTGRIAAVEDAIKMQMETVDKRNEQIKQLNELQQLVTTYQATFTSGEGQQPGAKGSELTIQVKPGSNNSPIYQYKSGGNWVDGPPPLGTGGTMTADRAKYEALVKAAQLGITIDLSTKSQVDTTLTNTKSQVDSLSNQTQMDLTRLQSLNNKRTEGFDFLTNWLKKMADTHSGIIRNMS